MLAIREPPDDPPARRAESFSDGPVKSSHRLKVLAQLGEEGSLGQRELAGGIGRVGADQVAFGDAESRCSESGDGV